MQETFQKMASELFSNSVSRPNAGWTMLGPGNYGPDAWATVQTSKGRQLTNFMESKLDTGSAMPQPSGQHLKTMSMRAILDELRADVSKCCDLPVPDGQPLQGLYPNNPVCEGCIVD